MPWSNGLTGNALAIACAPERRIRVVAGPGTGKSFAMQRRLMRLLEEGVSASRMLVVTFTRTAAASLVRDIAKLDAPGSDHIRAGTLHAYCYGLLMKRNVLGWTKRVPRALVTFSEQGILRFEAEPLLEDLSRVGDFGDKRERSQRVRANEAAWARDQSDDPGQPLDPTDTQFRNELLAWLKFHEAMLIGEVIPEALRFLRNNPASPDASAFDHVLVDEYQDLNRAEQVLLESLVHAGNYAVFGDEDQSIYSFRYAHPTGIVQFNDGHTGAVDHRLSECRRCPSRVVAVADALIRNNHPTAAGTRLHPRPTNSEGQIHIVQWNAIEDEARGVAEFVKSLIHTGGYKAGEILILCPRRLIAYQLRDAIVAAGVRLHSFFHEEALESHESRRAFSLLTLMANPKDRVALRYWLGDGSPTWNARGYAELRKHCEQTGQAPWDALQDLVAGRLQLPHCKSLVTKTEELNAQLGRLAGLPAPELLDVILPEAEGWAATLRFFATQGGAEGLDCGQLLEKLRESITQPELPEEDDCVQLMSLHKSKGLTRRAVIVVGCMQGLVPNLPGGLTFTEEEEHLHEQRRLFYVALTRCTDVLMLSSVARLESSAAYQIGVKLQGVRGEYAYPIASQFLDELGPTAPRSQRGDVFLRPLGL